MAPRILACFGRGFGPDSTLGHSGSESDQRRAGPVLVELFSSQGCKTSPDAENLISRLGRGDFAELEEEEGMLPAVVVLEFHVEYWDYLGWKDPFGSSMWTVRQKAYVESLKLDTLYTPQVVVMGRKECLGTEESNIISAVRSAPRFAAPTFQVSFQKPGPETLNVSLTGQLRMKVDCCGLDVMVALCESGLTTNCIRGENAGKMLSNDYVVRKLEKLCSVKDISSKKILSGTLGFSLWEGFDASKSMIVLFAQNSSNYHTFGVQKFKLPDGL